MQGELNLSTHSIPYTIKKNRRSRSISIRLKGSQIIVSQPYFLPYRAGEYFLKRNTDWVEKQIKGRFKNGLPQELKGTQEEYKKNKEVARKLVHARIKYFNDFYNFKVGRITIRNNSTRWGSCSRKGDINFHYKLALIDPKLADYVVVHELCHIKHLNHSEKFWGEVGKTIPDYKARRKRLKNYGNID